MYASTYRSYIHRISYSWSKLFLYFLNPLYDFKKVATGHLTELSLMVVVSSLVLVTYRIRFSIKLSFDCEDIFSVRCLNSP